MRVDIDSILKPYQRFGVHLGLERIQQLLANLGNPHHQVPVIHVAGTNGKGSVCAYLSAVLTHAGYRVGRYTSPHLVDWTERICLNEQPISVDTLQQLLLQVQDSIRPGEESPTQFEVFTAAAWLYFAQSRVDVAVVEVGLGGRLDATNVCDRPLVTAITSISWEHWQQLGPTLADIAREKAGILKPGCPAVIGPLPPVAEAVVRSRLAELGCPAVWVEPAVELRTAKAQQPKAKRSVRTRRSEFPLAHSEHSKIQNHASRTPVRSTGETPARGWLLKSGDPFGFAVPYGGKPSFRAVSPPTALAPKSKIQNGMRWGFYGGVEFELPLLGQVQLSNSAVAIAGLQVLQRLGWKIATGAIAAGMGKTRWPGRLEWRFWQGRPLLIDGAHNPAAAYALRLFVDTLDAGSVTWVMGMLSTKDHADIFEALLRPGDQLYLVPVPDHSSADPAELAILARGVCPELGSCCTCNSLLEALEMAVANHTVVLCGSLYLVGHFLRTAETGRQGDF